MSEFDEQDESLVKDSKNNSSGEDICHKISKDVPEITDETDDPPFSFKSPIFLEEIKMNLKMALPLIINNILQYLLMVETIAISGRSSSIELAGLGLGLTLSESFGGSVCLGFVSACDTLMSQAYGSENKKRVGLFLQRALLVLNIIPLVIWSLYFNFEPILIGIGQNPHVARIATEFLINYIPGNLFYMNYLILARYMQNQGYFLPSILAAFCGNVFNICSQLLFVTYLGFSYKAGAVCFCMSHLVMFLIELVYIIASKFYIPTWPGFGWEAFYDWKQMTTLGISGIAHTSFEVIFWQLGTLIGGLLGSIQLAASSILIQIMSIFYFIYVGVGSGSNIRIGQCLGANRPNQAKFAYRAAVTIILIISILCLILIICTHKYVPYIFTNQKDVISLIINTFPLVFIMFVPDALECVCIGSIRGCGKQMFSALVVFISFYLIGLPTTIILTFVFHFDIKGIWIGSACASFINVICNLIMLECQNWDKQAELAHERILFSTYNRELLNSSIQSESEQLLLPNSYRDGKIAGFKMLNHSTSSSILTPSNPVSCSIEYVPMLPPKYGKKNDLKKVLLSRAVIYLSFIIFFIGCILIHLFLPSQLYRPQNNTNFK